MDFLDVVQRVEYLLNEEKLAAKRGDQDDYDNDFPTYDEYELPRQKVLAARAKDPRANEIFDMPSDVIENFWEWEDQQKPSGL